MKKFLVSILTFLYISTATGATVHLHYCMGELVEWSFWKNENGKCDNCGMDKNSKEEKGCCKDEHKQIKLDKDQKITEPPFKVNQYFSLSFLIAYYVHLPDMYIISATEEKPVSLAPPRNIGVAVYIRNCVFLI